MTGNPESGKQGQGGAQAVNNAAPAAYPLEQYSVQPKSDDGGEKESPYFKSAAPSISLPKGGGAIKGIDEKFEVNAVNGTAGLSVPLPLSPGRGGFTPSVSLSYNSGSGNSEVGLGWSLGVPSIQRSGNKGLPRYDDANEGDVFLLAGAEDLVPEMEQDAGGKWKVKVRIPVDYDQYRVVRYRPRIEGLFARIERVSKVGETGFWWRVTTKDNITTWYGLTAAARIADPAAAAAAARIYRWLPQLSTDGKGNIQLWSYKAENQTNEPAGALYERNRTAGTYSNLYLERLQYCNLQPWYGHKDDPYAPVLPPVVPAGGVATEAVTFLMEALLDYNETNAHPWDVTAATLNTGWSYRCDAFSEYRAGFEIRTRRKCHRVLMFHRFEELDGAELVRSLELAYEHDGAGVGFLAEADYITSVTQTGYSRLVVGSTVSWRTRSLPAMTMAYQPLAWDRTVHEESPDSVINAPQGLTGPYQWIDLHGEGLPGILTEQAERGWYYKQNLGGGHFTHAQMVAPKPNFSGLGGGGLQWADLDADGRRQVVSMAAEAPGFFELADAPKTSFAGAQTDVTSRVAARVPHAWDLEWAPFRTFRERAIIDWDSPYTKMIDLDGDGRADALITEERAWVWYKNAGKDGYRLGGYAPGMAEDEEKGPRLVLNDAVQSIYLADMSGDGLTDLVRIRNSEVCYWPNLGWGRFGSKVSMKAPPVFDYPDTFNPLYLTLADISGTGAADIVYLGKSTFRIWVNQSGNGFGEARDIAVLPGMEPYSKVAVLDFLGNGTGCIVWSSPLPQYAGAPMRYVDLMGGVKPYLMLSHNNGMGKEVAVTYRSSTKYYLEDNLSSSPWATRLPFPVQCVSEVKHTDAVSQTEYTQSYRYHHGYYDHPEREFRGFGMVETLDTDSAKFYEPGGAEEHDLDQPPVLTKTWYHTGAWMQEGNLLDAFREEYYHFEGWAELPVQASFENSGNWNAKEWREAYRALKGSALRQEVYAKDGSDKENIPYTVTVSAYRVKLLEQSHRRPDSFQSGEGEKVTHAVFFTYSEQSLAWSCERSPEDARLAHTLTIEVDDKGNVERQASIAYPRTLLDSTQLYNLIAGIDFNDDLLLKATLDNYIHTPRGATAEDYRAWLAGVGILEEESKLVDARIAFPDAAQYQLGTGDFTMEAWVKPSCSDYETVLQYQSDCSGFFESADLYLYYGVPYFTLRDGANLYTAVYAGVTLPANSWSHLAFVRNGAANPAGWQLYVDGAAVSTIFYGSNGNAGGSINNCNLNTLHVGGRNIAGYLPNYLSGSIAGVHWYDHELTATEIADQYAAGRSAAPLASGVIFDLGTVPAPASGPLAVTEESSYDAAGTLYGSTQALYALASGAPAEPVAHYAPPTVMAEQSKTHITGSITAYTNDLEGYSFYRLRLPYDARAYELLKVPAPVPPGSLYTIADIADVLNDATLVIDLNGIVSGLPELRLLSCSRTLYRADDGVTVLPLGSLGEDDTPTDPSTLATLAIPYQQYGLAFTETTKEYCYDGRVDSGMLYESGYLSTLDTPFAMATEPVSAGGCWWLPSGEATFTPIPADDFYTPVLFTDPWGNDTAIDYWVNSSADKYWLLPQKITAAVGMIDNVTEVSAYDWRHLQPTEIIDVNLNKSGVVYDALGMAVAVAVMGKGAEGDYLEYADGSPIDPESEDELTDLQPRFWIDPQANGGDLLGRATWRTVYDLRAAPVRVAMIGREIHWEQSGGQTSPLLLRFTYTDGFGRVAMMKEQGDGRTADREWIGSGKTVYNNKGKVVLQYEPYFSPTWEYDYALQSAEAEHGVSPRMHYDPVDRNYRTEMPDGTFSYTLWDNWSQTVYDATDSLGYWTGAVGSSSFLSDSEWYNERSAGTYGNTAGEKLANQQAAEKAALLADTPQVMYLDTLARPFYTVRHNRYIEVDPFSVESWVDQLIHDYSVQDVQSNTLAFHDGEGRDQLTYRYNYLKAACQQVSIDGGEGHSLADAAGQPLYGWDAGGYRNRMTYDALRRPLDREVRNDGLGMPVSVLERTVWGEGQPGDQGSNLRGQVYQHSDGAGKKEVSAYDFKGLPLNPAQYLLSDGTLRDADWNTGPGLESVPYTSTMVMDALGRPGELTDPGGHITRNTYGKDGALKSVTLEKAGSGTEDTYVQDIRHNARGQREAIWYGNGTKTSYFYDDLSYQLRRLRTMNLVANERVQDMKYAYDASGNATSIRDKAQNVIFYDNRAVDPDGHFTYDALYRLIKAEGRENIKPPFFGDTDNTSDGNSFVSRLTPFDGSNTALQNYVQRYDYDKVGNIMVLRHIPTTAGGYTRSYTYESGSNRLTKTVISGNAPNIPDYLYQHDGRGNMTWMPHLHIMDYDATNQMCRIADKVSGTTMEAFYQYSGGERMRKVVQKGGGIAEERIYLGSFEVYRKSVGGSLTVERQTVHVGDDAGRVAMLELRISGSDTSDTELTRFVYSNHLGSATLELTWDREIISYEEYHPYGTTAYQARNENVDAVAKRYRYTGKERDEESGLNYHSARYYALWLCRWCAVDVLERKFYGNSPYEYCFASPSNYIDSNGQQPDLRSQLKANQTSSELQGNQNDAIMVLNQHSPTFRNAVDQFSFEGQYSNVGVSFGFGNIPSPPPPPGGSTTIIGGRTSVMVRTLNSVTGQRLTMPLTNFVALPVGGPINVDATGANPFSLQITINNALNSGDQYDMALFVASINHEITVHAFPLAQMIQNSGGNLATLLGLIGNPVVLENTQHVQSILNYGSVFNRVNQELLGYYSSQPGYNSNAVGLFAPDLTTGVRPISSATTGTNAFAPNNSMFNHYIRVLNRGVAGSFSSIASPVPPALRPFIMGTQPQFNFVKNNQGNGIATPDAIANQRDVSSTLPNVLWSLHHVFFP